MKRYIKISQDGIGRLIFDKRTDINGLYTDDLQTCFVVAIVGNLGISLMHNTGRFSQQTLNAELTFVGALEKCHIVLGPLVKKSVAIGCLGEFYLNIRDKITFSKSTSVAIDRTKSIYSKLNSEDIIDFPPEHQRRHDIGVYNNILSKDGGAVSGDLQFDGAEFSSCPELLGAIEDVRSAVRERNLDSTQKSIFLFNISQFEAREEARASIIKNPLGAAFGALDFQGIADQLNREYERIQGLYQYDKQATTIQALFRGHAVRKNIQEPTRLEEAQLIPRK